MSLINSSIKSFAGANPSSFARRKSSDSASKTYSPPSGFGGNDSGSNGDSGAASSGGSSGFGGVDSYAGGDSPAGMTQDNGQTSGWWMCADSGSGAKAIAYLHVENIDIRKPKRFIRHPIETGTVVIDHVVEDPWMADVKGIVEDEQYSSGGSVNAVEEVERVLKAAYKNRKLSNSMSFILGKNGKVIIDKDGSPVNFQLADYSGRISKERIGIYEYTVKLQEIMTTESKQESVSSPDNADTVRG